ncbi:MAG TPA: hypothetical protein VHA15_15080 [Burkholderiales bacterium]|nr:hypothetical protein [Burkholderiales bacterium]
MAIKIRTWRKDMDRYRPEARTRGASFWNAPLRAKFFYPEDSLGIFRGHHKGPPGAITTVLQRVEGPASRLTITTQDNPS